MSIPLRGELTAPVVPSNHVPSGLDIVQDLMTQFLRVSSRSGVAHNHPAPTINIVNQDGNAPVPLETPSLSQKAKDATASWSLTASDAASTEAAILPILVRLATAKDDIEGVKFCIATDDAVNTNTAPGSGEALTSPREMSSVASGVVNALDTSSRSPLHIAALNGSMRCAELLLQSGASVHWRDSLDHTALYYVSLPAQPVY